jgi:CheY-like chemotaxis protein
VLPRPWRSCSNWRDFASPWWRRPKPGWRARAEPPHLVLCDLTLPGALDGHGFARACRADAALRGLRLVAVSGYCRAEDRRRATESGFDELIAKPIALASIHAAFREVRTRLSTGEF